jgi:hypothetical protein
MVIYNYKTISEIPLIFLCMVISLNGILSIFTAYYFRKYGFLGAVLIHFWTDVIWHIIWGLIQ